MLIEKDKLIKLLEIIDNAPASRIAHFNDNDETATEVIYNFCREHEYEYHLNATNELFYDKVKSEYDGKDVVSITNFNLKRANYRVQGREYEYIFVSSQIEDIDSFLSRCYHIVKHAGNIIIFIKKDDYDTKYRYIELLEKNNFVATNTIDDLFEEFSVIISKRMHGWGN